MRKATKLMILCLLVDAGAVCVMQLLRWPGAWAFVALYWGILTAKNYIDWKSGGRKDGQ